MSSHTGPWILRAGAWLILLTVAGQLVFNHRSATINGRVTQLHVLFESQQASNALLQEWGLTRCFNPLDYRLFPMEFWRVMQIPTHLKIKVRCRDSYPIADTFIWVNSKGFLAYPPLGLVRRNSNEESGDPQLFCLPDRDGRRIRVAVCGPDFSDEESDRTVWILRDDRWVNAVRFTMDIEKIGHVEFHAPVPENPDATVDRLEWDIDLGHSTWILEWDSTREAFTGADNPPPGIILKPLFPDQIEPPLEVE